MSPSAIDRSIEILQTQLVLYNYFYYISCHFVTLTTLEYLCFPSNAGSWRFSNREWNFSSRKLLLQAVCYCLHLILRLWLKSSTLLFYSELKRHCLCTVPTCHICIIACLILSTEVSNIKKVCARSLPVKICLQVKMNLFVSDVIVTNQGWI